MGNERRYMTSKVSTLHNVTLAGGRYSVIVVNESGYGSHLQRAIERESGHFGKQIGTHGTIVRGHDDQTSANLSQELFAKPWDAETRGRILSEYVPFLLVIATDYHAFDPRHDDWAIVWFAALRAPKKSVPSVFGALAREIVAGRSLIGFLRSKATTPDSTFRRGSISANGLPTHPMPKPGAGRPSLLDSSLDWGATAKDLASRAVVDPLKRGWKTALADQVAARFFSDNGNPKPSCKSLRDALARKCFFSDYEAAYRAGDAER